MPRIVRSALIQASNAISTDRPLEQIRKAMIDKHLKLIEGRAGTGKSYTLAAIRDAYERDGKRVVGLAPTNAVAQDLAADGWLVAQASRKPPPRMSSSASGASASRCTSSGDSGDSGSSPGPRAANSFTMPSRSRITTWAT